MFTINDFAIQHGSHVNAEKERDEYWKYIPLYQAALRGDWESAERFFMRDEGSLTARITKFSETALHISVAAGSGSPKSILFVKNLLEKMPLEALEIGDQFNATALHNAAWVGNLEAAKALVEKHQRLLYRSDSRKLLPLHLAAMNAHKETLLYLLEVTNCDPVSKLFSDDDSAADFFIFVIVAGFYDVALDLVHKYPSLAMAKRDNDDCALKAISRKVSAFPSGDHPNFWQRIIYNYNPSTQYSTYRQQKAGTVLAKIKGPTSLVLRVCGYDRVLSLSVSAEEDVNPVKLEDDSITDTNEGDIENPVNISRVTVQKYRWGQLLMEWFSLSGLS
ncbi:hypothetical protein Vadar_009481 [Vaccinium darrowii]|uniref:Uncharacterized protein n=1 Tax=Vaccinium darrowii TaxID=229202 RepID=A0ACB7YDR5_9ERIC|nr:hypothetical protein Vadar_009481 [Vaccinium darrowii]